MRRFLFTLVQLTWGLPQTLLGFIMYLYWLPQAKTRYVYHGAIVTEWTSGGGISLGLFVFVSGKARPSVTVHEYGHCIQSLLLGPLYLIAVGIPSYLWQTSLPCGRCAGRRAAPTTPCTPRTGRTPWANGSQEKALHNKGGMPVLKTGRRP